MKDDKDIYIIVPFIDYLLFSKRGFRGWSSRN